MNETKKYILKVYYTECSGKRTLAELLVTEPKKVEDGIWATSENIFGGTSRHFYRACDVVALYPSMDRAFAALEVEKPSLNEAIQAASAARADVQPPDQSRTKETTLEL